MDFVSEPADFRRVFLVSNATNISITSVSSNVKEVHALNTGDINLDVGGSSQRLHGNSGNNVITGHDRLYGEGGAETFRTSSKPRPERRIKFDKL